MKSELRMTNGRSSLNADSNVSRVSAHSSLIIFSAALSIFLLLPSTASACATCYGASDSPLADGMNWGIITLLGFIGSVLVAITAFFAYIIRRAAKLEAAALSQIQTDPHP